MALMIDRNAPGSGLASLQAMQGRYGDTELVHMSKPEVQGLASLGQLTVNPQTGLPEAFSLGNLIPIIANIGLGVATGGLSTPAQIAIMGAANFAMAKAQGADTGDALLKGLMAGIGTGVSSAISGASGLSEGISSAGQVGADIAAGTTGLGGDFASQAIAMDPSIITAGGMNPATGLAAISPASAGAIQATPLYTGPLPDMATDTLQAVMPESLIENTAVGGDLYSAFAKPQLSAESIADLQAEIASRTIPSTQPLAKFADPKVVPDVTKYSLAKDYKPDWIQRNIFGKEAVPAGELTREQFIELGGTPSDATLKEMAVPRLKQPSTYIAPIAGAVASGDLFGEEEEEGDKEKKKATMTEYDFARKYQQPANLTQKEILNRALYGGGYPTYYTDSWSQPRIVEIAAGGQPHFEGQVKGPGDGQSDEVAFRVDGGQIDGAMLSPDEYVLAADVVSAIGNGSSDAGAAKLDKFMAGVRDNAYGTTQQMKPFKEEGLSSLVA